MIIQNMIDRILIKIIRDHRSSTILRRRYNKNYNIKIGEHTIGAFDRWRISPGTRIGRYCSIASTARIIDANHPIDAISTHPYFYLRDWGMVDDDKVNITPTIVEDDVWMGHQSVLTPDCNRVGRGAVIGAGAIIMRDVPAYAIMTGAPARVTRMRFSPDVVEALEATQWWEYDPPQLRAALAAAPGFLEHPTTEGVHAFLRALGRPEWTPSPVQEATTQALQTYKLDKIALADVLRKEIPTFSLDELEADFADLQIDSFGLINFRISLEAVLGEQISDHVWSRIKKPSDLIALTEAPAAPEPIRLDIIGSASESRAESGPVINGATESRHYTLNMPQMALQGLSESWLFKEVGDLHWSNITRGLQTSSARIADDTGSRLYATFTRFLLESEVPLAHFAENDAFEIEMAANRMGAGIFFGDATLRSPTGFLRARVMTSFSKFGEHGANTSLLKGQPQIPANCPIPALDKMPAFGSAYRDRRADLSFEPLHETEYTIQPPHDINGVGLLYFAAYPMIAELCSVNIGGQRIAMEYSTKRRDIFYFANCGVDETLIYRVASWDEGDNSLSIDATLSRKSDGVIMAYISTEKRRLTTLHQTGTRPAG